MTRTILSSHYLVGTLAGALALPTVGRLIDTWGLRRTMTLVAGLFGLALISATAATVAAVLSRQPRHARFHATRRGV